MQQACLPTLKSGTWVVLVLQTKFFENEPREWILIIERLGVHLFYKCSFFLTYQAEYNAIVIMPGIPLKYKLKAKFFKDVFTLPLQLAQCHFYHWID